MINAYVLTDLGYGDSGKGATVDYIIREMTSKTLSKIVVRLQGGHQVGHTVIHNGIHHEFRNFGSGTCQNIETYYGPETTLCPMAAEIEYDIVYNKFRIIPKVIYHPDAMITTEYDIKVNRWEEDNRGDNRHGSVGMGFNKTIERNKKCQFTAEMMNAPEYIIRMKLNSIRNYYISNGVPSGVFEECNLNWELSDILRYRDKVKVEDFGYLRKYSDIIFEPNQGILLDQKYGMFPHVTRSTTTAEKPMEFIKNILSLNGIVHVHRYDISRIYHTRHGAGPFDIFPIELKNTENESNITNTYQMEFKVSKLDLRLLNYAMTVNNRFFTDVSNSTVIFTCLDQLTTEKIEFIDLDGTEKSENLIDFLSRISNDSRINTKFATSSNPLMNLIYHCHA